MGVLSTYSDLVQPMNHSGYIYAILQTENKGNELLAQLAGVEIVMDVGVMTFASDNETKIAVSIVHLNC